MTLDDIVTNEIKELGNHTAILRKDKSNVESGKGLEDAKPTINLGLRYIPGEVSPEQYQAIEQLSPEQLETLAAEYLPGAYKNARNQLIEKVSPHYSEILDKLNGGKLLNLLQTSPAYNGTNKEYKEIGEAQESYKKWDEIAAKEDTEAYVNSSKHPIITKALKLLNEEILKKLLKARVGIEQQKFLGYFVDFSKINQEALRESENQAEVIGKNLNIDKTRAYLKETAIGLNDNEKEDANETAGMLYSQHLIEEEIKAKNKKVKEAYEIGATA